MMYAAASTMNNDPPEPSVGSIPSFEEPAPNLEVIYQAFGEQADLYKDVLQVKPIATAEQIQMAYFDRRSELFALLASIDSEEEQDDITASHRFHAERKMDAVVMAVRILGDPHLRQEYDNVLALSNKKKQPKEPPSSAASKASSTREPDGVYAGIVEPVPPDVPPSPRGRRSPKRKSPKRRSRRVSPSDTDTIPEEHQLASGEEVLQLHHYQVQEPDYEFVTQSTKGSKSKKKSSKKKNRNNDRSHYEDDSSSHHQTTDYYDESVDQSRIQEDDSTFPDHTVNYATGTLNDDDQTLESKRTWDDQATITSQSTNGGWTRDSRQVARGGTSTLSNITNSGIVSRIQEEVAGTVEDTLVSFEQVLNVFTLQERDILAVMGRIDKAKRQLRKRR